MFEIDPNGSYRVVIGSGFAAAVNISTLLLGQTWDNLKIICIGDPDPWASYHPALEMGQCRELLCLPGYAAHPAPVLNQWLPARIFADTTARQFAILQDNPCFRYIHGIVESFHRRNDGRPGYVVRLRERGARGPTRFRQRESIFVRAWENLERFARKYREIGVNISRQPALPPLRLSWRSSI
jgi:hypothetical protein